MKQKLLWMILVLSMTARGAALDTAVPYPPELKPVPQEAKAAHLAANLLSRFHYKAIPLDDDLSSKVFDQYLKTLDFEKLYFIQTDIDHFAADRTKLDDAILTQNLNIPFEIFNLYERRAAENFAYARTLIKQGFVFLRDESYQYDRKKESWSKSEADLRDLWRKRVKNDWLRLKLAGMDDVNIAKTLDKRYDNALKRLSRMTSTDAFQTFMNAYTTAIEPHTNYLAPRAAEDFNISMSLSLVGIGAVLSEVDELTTIRELVPGGPASLSGQLKVGDRIVGVAQGQAGVMTDVIGMRLEDTVALIRGAANSTVRLDVLPANAGPDGPHKKVTLVRKTISLQDQAAKSTVYPVTDDKGTRRIAVISLPSFYEDFAARQSGAADYKSATRDVLKLLGNLKKERVDGVLMDLRNNGGGSLREAIDLAGLFLGKAPVVQQRNANGDISVERPPGATIAWDGPLGVLINRGSASASEIFAAAIQDYGRGLIFGEPSFGKGTVQTMADLDQIARNPKPQFGELKMTIAQFFRVNGGTTQLRGVTPDIAFPESANNEDFGESSYDNALPWVKIKAADYTPVGDMKGILPALVARHETRIKNDKEFQYLLEDIAQNQQLRKKNQISLNEVERRKEREVQEKRLASRRSASTANPSGAASGADDSLEDDGLQVNERKLSKELAVEKTKKSAKDVLQIEAVNILSDYVTLQKTNIKLAEGSRP
jgi:carboxyl-terminal processing protease